MRRPLTGVLPWLAAMACSAQPASSPFVGQGGTPAQAGSQSTATGGVPSGGAPATGGSASNPTGGGIGAGGTAAISYSGSYSVVNFGFPIESIDGKDRRSEVLERVFDFFGL